MAAGGSADRGESHPSAVRRRSGGHAHPDRSVGGEGVQLALDGAGFQLAHDGVRQGAELGFHKRRIAARRGGGEEGGVHLRRAVVDQPGQTARAAGIIEVQQGILGEEFAPEFQDIVQLKALEPARVAGRDRAGLVQIEHDIVEKKEHRQHPPSVRAHSGPLMLTILLHAIYLQVEQ